MKNHRSALLVALTLTTVISAMAATALYPSAHVWQQERTKRPAEDKLKKLPVVDFDAPEPFDQNKREERRAKSKKYNDPTSGSRRNHILTSRIGAIRNEWDFGLESAIPIAQSSAVITGEVVDASAYLSEDKYAVYSEFTVKVDEVLKNDMAVPAVVGGTVVTERFGGRVRVPSGRVGSFYVSGQGVPELGNRYVLFLGFSPRESGVLADPRVSNRHILTAYELRAGQVFPLDSSGAKDFVHYEGMNEAAFLNLIRQSLASSSLASPK